MSDSLLGRLEQKIENKILDGTLCRSCTRAALPAQSKSVR